MTTSTEIAATEAELKVAEALAAEIRKHGLSSFADYHDVSDANAVLADTMAAEGIDIRADEFAAANRITATVDLLLNPDIDRYDENGEPLSCEDCSRPIAWDEQRGDYRHMVDPARGCYLILPEQSDPATRARRARLIERLDRPAQPPERSPAAEPPGTRDQAL